MQTFMANRGVVSAILDHGEKTRALNGKEQQCMHLQVEWQEDTGDKSFSWEPFTNIFRDVPSLVQEYFDSKSLDIRELLDQEAKARDRKTYFRQ